MANDQEWNRHSTEWVEMSHKSRLRKEALGKSRPSEDSGSAEPSKQPRSGKPMSRPNR